MERIPLGLLYSFVVFNQSRNINEAAAQLGITQPALSKQLKHLEKNLREPIFTLKGRRKTLTPFGQTLQRRLEERLGNVQEIIEQSRVHHLNSRNATLRVVARSGILGRISHKLEFDGALFFIDSSNESIIESLLKLRAEIGITYIVPDSHELIAKPLFRESFQLVIPKILMPHRPKLAAPLFLRLQDLACIGYKPDDEMLHSLYTAFNPKSPQPKLRMLRATENYVRIAAMVNSGLGWAVIPTYLNISKKRNWILPIPSQALPTRQFYVLYRAEFATLPWFRNLLAEIQSCFAKQYRVSELS